MWNKLILLCLCSSLYTHVEAQNFLGRSQAELMNYLHAQGNRVSKIQVKEDTIQFNFKEEDERNRLFNTTYYLVLKNKRCTSEVKQVELNDYWINSLVDIIQVKKGKPLGTKIFDYDDFAIYSTYRFTDFNLKLKQEDNYLWVTFEGKP